MKLLELLNENIEDEQSEANEKAVALLMMAKTFMLKAQFQQYKKQWNDALKAFSDGYEEDNDNLMYGGLDDLVGVGDDLWGPVKKHFGEKFDAKYRWFQKKTHEFESRSEKKVSDVNIASADALAKYRAKKKVD